MTKEVWSESEGIRFVGIEEFGPAIFCWFEAAHTSDKNAKFIAPHGEVFHGYRIPSRQLERRRNKLVEEGITPTETDKALKAVEVARERRRDARHAGEAFGRSAVPPPEL